MDFNDRPRAWSDLKPRWDPERKRITTANTWRIFLLHFCVLPDKTYSTNERNIINYEITIYAILKKKTAAVYIP